MKRKFMSLILALAMILSLFVPALAVEGTSTYVIPEVAGKIVILHTNDVHGADVAIPGTSIGTGGVAQLKKDFEDAGAKVLLLSAGDAIMGKPLVSADKGKSAIDFMNAAGYDAMAVGNHELDFGLENLKALAAQAHFPILDANMTTVADGKTVFDATKIFEIDGVKVGVFGLSTPETLTKADASKMPGVTFQQGDKLYELAQAQVAALKAAGADIIVCLGHLGVDAESVPNRSIDLCEAVDGIDLFIDGHSHSTTAQIISAINNADKNNIVNGAKIVSTGTALANVGMVVYDKTAKTLADSLISAKEYNEVDADVDKVVNDRDTAVNDQYGSIKVGTSEVDLNGTQSGGKGTAENTGADIMFPAGEGLRVSETNLGDFSADAILWQARQTLGEDKVDLAITNGGGIRKTLGKGDISMLNLLAVYPFGNTVATIKVTGAELLEALEASTQFVPNSASGGFPQVSGINFTIKAYIPYVQGDQYPASTYYAPKNPGDRVTIHTVNGKAFDLKATYTVATNDFTAKGGDTFGIFKKVGGWMDTGVTLENALINYTEDELGGNITAEKYGASAGRITISNVMGKVIILHTNDVHGADVAVPGTTIGTAGVAQLKKDLEAAGAKVLLLSAGDAIMGKPLVSADKGKSAIDFMNAAGYDAMAVGNHELDFGLENLKALAAQAHFPILDANMTTVADGETVFDANRIFTIDGVKVGVFGLSTPETLTKADASKMPGVTFQQGDKLYELAQAQVAALKAGGADVIVCLGHLGVDAESIPNRSIDLCTKVNGIDLFIDGHSHSTTAQIISAINNADKNNIVNGAKIVSTGTALANVGMVVYDKTAKTLADSLISAKEYNEVDADVDKVVNDRDTAVNDQYGSIKVGTSEVDLNGTQSGGKGTAENTGADIMFPAGEGLRVSETNLGDFSADAILWQARQTLGEDKVDLAITNGGGIRKTLGKGDISMLNLLAVYPFGNTVATIKVTGAELLEALEASTQFVPNSASGGFPQVSGINFTIKAYIPYVQGDQYPASTYYAPKNPGDRVTIHTVNGKAFDLKATYTVATNDFTAKGGDTFGIFKKVGGWMDTGVTLENALINYTEDELNGVITAEKYGKSAGRIAIETSAPTSGTGSGNTTTTITTNPDGSKTTTVTDKTTGTVTATTIALNGTKSVVVAKKDGTVSAKVDISAEALKSEEGKTPVVTLPGVAFSSDKAPTISITSAKPLTVVIPLADAKPGVVAVLVHADGTEEVLKKSVTSEEGLVASLDGSATLKIINNSKNFSDIPENNWAASAAAFASSRELFQGTSDNTFSPAMPMTRGMLVTVLHRLEDKPEGNKASFEDVNTNGWYADAVNWASETGIVNGISSNSFAPDDSITRESLAVMLYRYARVLELDTQARNDVYKSFVDNGNVSAWAAEAMNWAVQNEILTGKNGNTLDPNGIASRAEVAIMIMRFVEKL
jgi:2',3'-cyclic-nucleotide 2'-phosphodiesterase (5'-nucleotidase family)